MSDSSQNTCQVLSADEERLLKQFAPMEGCATIRRQDGITYPKSIDYDRLKEWIQTQPAGNSEEATDQSKADLDDVVIAVTKLMREKFETDSDSQEAFKEAISNLFDSWDHMPSGNEDLDALEMASAMLQRTDVPSEDDLPGLEDDEAASTALTATKTSLSNDRIKSLYTLASVLDVQAAKDDGSWIDPRTKRPLWLSEKAKALIGEDFLREADDGSASTSSASRSWGGQMESGIATLKSQHDGGSGSLGSSRG